MAFREKKLEWGDIDQTQPSVQKLETFKRLADFAIAAGARVVEIKPGAKPWINMLEQFYWRAEELYVLKPKDKKASPCDIYHPTIHYLFARKYGKELGGRPLCLLLSESLASMSEYYFVLESFSKFGPEGLHEGNFIRSLIDFEKKRLGITEKSDATIRMRTEVRLLRFLFAESSDPYSAFRDAATEMFEYFRYMYETGLRRIEGQSLDFSDYVDHCEKLKYGSFILRYNIGLNVADAIAHCGRASTQEDQAAVEDCLSALKSSKGLLEFLRALGLPE